MYIKQQFSNARRQAAYYFESKGEAAIIDPSDDIEEYLLLAKERQTSIKYIFNTHVRKGSADGLMDLAKATKAAIVFGPEAATNVAVYQAKDGDAFSIGQLTIKVLHTAGQTPESTCYVLQDENSRDHAIFTGNLLSIGEGRMHEQPLDNLLSGDVAGLLYDSLQNKIIPLNNDVIVYPAFLPGDNSIPALDSETFSTIGRQKQTNFALKQPSKEAFIKALSAIEPKKQNYKMAGAGQNDNECESNGIVLQKPLTPLSVTEFKQKMSDEIVLVDTRNAGVFSQGFIPGCISIGLDGNFEEWAANLLLLKKPVLLVTSPGHEMESSLKLSKVGILAIEGYLDGGFEAWQKANGPMDMIIDIEADELAMDIPFDEKLVVVDVRKEVEFADGHVKGAVNIPLADLADPASLANFDDNQNLYVHCANGYRSVIALSLIKREGFHNARNVVGGWAAIKELNNIEIEKDASVLN